MAKRVEGVYRQGRVELLEPPGEVGEETPVIVMFLEPSAGSADLRAVGIDEAAAAELRARFGLIAEDWDDPAMDVYDDYDVVKVAQKRGVAVA